MYKGKLHCDDNVVYELEDTIHSIQAQICYDDYIRSQYRAQARYEERIKRGDFDGPSPLIIGIIFGFILMIISVFIFNPFNNKNK